MPIPITGAKGISTQQSERLDQMGARIQAGMRASGQQDPQSQARKVLTSLMGDLHNQGKPRTGYLKLIYSTDSSRDMAFKTKSSWGMKLTSDRNRETAAALRALFVQAGYSTEKLDTYLSQRQSAGKARLQSSEVFKLLQSEIGEPKMPDSTRLDPRNIKTYLSQHYVHELLSEEGFRQYLGGLQGEKHPRLQQLLSGKTAKQADDFLEEHRRDYLNMLALQFEDDDARQAKAPVSELLRTAGLKAVNVPDDGHCLFHALAVAEGGMRRQAFDADPYAANDQHRLALHATLGSLTAAQIQNLKWNDTARQASESRLLGGVGIKRAMGEAWGTGSELALKAIECSRRVICVVPGQISVYYSDGSSRVIKNPERQALKNLLQDPQWDALGPPLIVWNETNTHWQATELLMPPGIPNAKPELERMPVDAQQPQFPGQPAGPQASPASSSHLQTIKRAHIDGLEQPIALGGAPVDGDCGLHALSSALGAPLSRAQVADAALLALDDIQRPDDLRYQMMYEDLRQPGVLRQGDPPFTFEAFKSDRAGWAARWREAFAGEGAKERVWIADHHIAWISRWQQRPVEIYLPTVEDPALLARSRFMHEDLPGPPLRLVNTDSNMQRGRRELNTRVQQFFGRDDLTVDDLLRARQGETEQLDPEAEFALYARLEEEYALEELPADVDSNTARLDKYLQSLFEQQQGNHWDSLAPR